MKKGVIIDPELRKIVLITLVLAVVGLTIFFLKDAGYVNGFNFYSSRINVSNTQISEELHYKPNQDYHTIYRNFVSPVYWKNTSNKINNTNYLEFSEVECSFGTPYVKDFGENCYNSEGIFNCPSYTEKNEYGCTYGNNLGFQEGKDYVLKSKYEINPQNIFYIKGNYYIKFVVYSSYNHIKLTHKNFVVNGNVIKDKKYLPNENVVVYIPYGGDTSSFNILNSPNFEFDSTSDIFYILLAIIPSLFFFFIWYFFGKEKSYEEVPGELSTFPNKRKFWEVSVYFNPPIFSLDKNFFSSVLLNFYNKKVIDIKEEGKEIYIKLNPFKGDSTEKKVYSILFEIKKSLAKDKDSKLLLGEYFNLKKAMSNNPNLKAYRKFINLKKDLKKEGKKYVEDNSQKIIPLCFFFLIFGFIAPIFISFSRIFFLYFSSFSLVLLFLGYKSTLFMRYKKNYYEEYQKWKSFKSYLKNSFSIKTATHKTIVIWKEYLIYATALGVPDRIIKELKQNDLITSHQSKFYVGIATGSYFGFNNFGMSGGPSGMSGGMSGGFGGAGGGGIGGGGGGGR